MDNAQRWLQIVYDSAIEKSANVKKENVYITATASIVVAYICTVRYYRYKNINLIRKKYPNPDDILNDSEAAQFIYNITTRKEFPC